MAVFIVILLLAYVIVGLVKNILWIWEWAIRREEKLNEKYSYRKKLEE